MERDTLSAKAFTLWRTAVEQGLPRLSSLATHGFTWQLEMQFERFLIDS